MSKDLNILVVEDESIVALYLKKKLQTLGYTPQAIVTNGIDALAEAEQLRPDVVLMDINLEGEIDGIDTATKLKASYDVPIIYITAYSDEETLARAKKTEPYGYLIKPFETGDIKVTIEIALYKYKLDKKLRKSEEKFRLLAENTRDIICLHNEDGTFDYVSPSVKNIMGYKPEELEGELPIDYVIEQDREDLEVDSLKELIDDNESRSFVLRFLHKDGHPIWIETLVEPLEDFYGNITGYQTSSRNVSERVEAEKKLEKSNAQLKELTLQLQNLQEEERKHLSQEIHDVLGQELIGLKMELSWLKNHSLSDNEEAEDEVQKAIDKVHEVISSVRNLAGDLRPVLLDKLGLEEAIKHEIEVLQEKVDFKISLNVPEEKITLGTDESVAVYRIFQESMTNIIKHAKATKVEINLENVDHAFTLRIKDNGQGASIEEIENKVSHGVIGMRERAENLGGTFKLDADPGEGTKICVEFEY